jgi:Helix-turn-helix domain
MNRENESPVVETAASSAFSMMTTKEVAQYLGVVPQTIEKSRMTGKLFGIPAPKFIKRGRLVFYRLGELEQWHSQFEECQTVEEAAFLRFNREQEVSNG